MELALAACSLCRLAKVSRAAKLLLALGAVFGRPHPVASLLAAMLGNAALAALTTTTWCKPTNHETVRRLRESGKMGCGFQ